jgi:hypothetical protein
MFAAFAARGFVCILARPPPGERGKLERRGITLFPGSPPPSGPPSPIEPRQLSGRSLGVVRESERQLWLDHPSSPLVAPKLRHADFSSAPCPKSMLARPRSQVIFRLTLLAQASIIRAWKTENP